MWMKLLLSKSMLWIGRRAARLEAIQVDLIWADILSQSDVTCCAATTRKPETGQPRP